MMGGKIVKDDDMSDEMERREWKARKRKMVSLGIWRRSWRSDGE